MAWTPYDSHKLRQYTGNPINVLTATLKILLLTSAYTPNRATHVFQTDLTNEVTGSNYSAGGATLANVTAAIVSNLLHVDADNVQWAQHASGFANARTAALVAWSGVAATSPLIAYLPFAGDVGNVNGPLTIPIVDIWTF